MALSATYYTAAWCGPCKTFKPLATKVMADVGIPMTIQDIDEAGPEVVKSNNIRGVPTIIFSNGERIVGNWPETKLREQLNLLQTGDDGH